jgi:RNA polymerase sigma-70 factor (ECF subfamily)
LARTRAHGAGAATAPDPEAGLLARVERGEEAALVALYDRAAGTVYACCVRILGDADEARDVTSEAFWRIWCRASSYDPERCSAMAWILTVTRRLALDRRRSLLRRAGAHARARIQPRPSEEAVDRTLARVEIASAFSHLSPADRRLLESAYFEGLSGADIAARDRIPLGTVKSRMRAALARLRTAFHGGRP